MTSVMHTSQRDAKTKVIAHGVGPQNGYPPHPDPTIRLIPRTGDLYSVQRAPGHRQITTTEI